MGCFEWLRIFTRRLSAEQQQFLCISLQELHFIAAGAKWVTLRGETPPYKMNPKVAKWAIPYAERILDAGELFRRGEFRDALSIFQSLKRNIPDAAIVLMNIGVCYAELGEKQKAESWLKKSLREIPSSHRRLVEENLRRLQD